MYDHKQAAESAVPDKYKPIFIRMFGVEKESAIGIVKCGNGFFKPYSMLFAILFLDSSQSNSITYILYLDFI